MLVLVRLVRSFSYTPDATFSEEFLLHTSYMFIRDEFLLHTSCYIYSLGVSLTLLMLCLFVRSFSYTPDVIFIPQDFVLHTSCYIYS